jgi:outer membrane protein
MKKHTLLHAFGLFALTGTLLFADKLGGELVVGAFAHSPSGSASYALPFEKTASYDIERDFGWSDETDIILEVSFEHPIPFVPNVKAAYHPLYYSGTADVNDFSWGALHLPQGRIASDLELDIFDATFYYQLLDGSAELDAGITIRKLSGDFDIDTLATFQQYATPVLSETVSFDEYIPMLYGKTVIHIPDTDFSISGTVNYFNYDDTTHYDIDVGARYVLALGFGIEGGYRYTKLQTKDDFVEGLDIDIDVSGFYAAVVWEF